MRNRGWQIKDRKCWKKTKQNRGHAGANKGNTRAGTAGGKDRLRGRDKFLREKVKSGG